MNEVLQTPDGNAYAQFNALRGQYQQLAGFQGQMNEQQKDLFDRLGAVLPKLRPRPDYKKYTSLFEANRFKSDTERKAAMQSFAIAYLGDDSPDPIGTFYGGRSKVPDDAKVIEDFAELSRSFYNRDTLYGADQSRIDDAVAKKADQLRNKAESRQRISASAANPFLQFGKPPELNVSDEEWEKRAKQSLFKDDRVLQLNTYLDELSPATQRIVKTAPFSRDFQNFETFIRRIPVDERATAVAAMQLINPANDSLWSHFVAAGAEAYRSSERFAEQQAYEIGAAGRGNFAFDYIGTLERELEGDLDEYINADGQYVSEEARATVAEAMTKHDYKAAQDIRGDELLDRLPGDIAEYRAFLETQQIERLAERALHPRLSDDAGLIRDMATTTAELIPFTASVALASYAGGPAAGFAMGYTLQHDSIKSSYMEAGFDPRSATLLADIITVPVAAAEYLGAVNVFKTGVNRKFVEGLSANYKRIAGEIIRNKFIDGAEEVGTEVVQQVIEDSVLVYAEEFAQMEGIEGLTFNEAFENAKTVAIETLKGMPGLLAGPATFDLTALGVHKATEGRISFGQPGAYMDIEKALGEYRAAQQNIREKLGLTEEGDQAVIEEDEQGNAVIVIPEEFRGNDTPAVPASVYEAYRNAKTAEERAKILEEADYSDGVEALQERIEVLQQIEAASVAQASAEIDKAYQEHIYGRDADGNATGVFGKRMESLARSIQGELDAGATMDSVLAQLIARYNGGNANVVVVNNPLELMDFDLPGDIRQMVVSGEVIEGFVHDGTVYLVKQGLDRNGAGPAQAVAKFAHEFLIHRNVDTMGAEGITVLNQAASILAEGGFLSTIAQALIALNPNYRQQLRGADGKLDPTRIAEEWIARIGEGLIDPATLEVKQRNAWDKVRSWIGQHLGIETIYEWSDRQIADLATGIMQQAQGTTSDGKPRFSLAPPVESQAFRAWFGDYSDPDAYSSKRVQGKPDVSMVINDDGSPREVYHFTDAEFEEFRRQGVGDRSTVLGSYETPVTGIFFSETESDASVFGRRRIAAYLNIKYPLDLTDTGNVVDQAFLDELSENGINPNWFFNIQNTWELFDDGEAFVQALENMGYDGVFFDDTNPETGDSFRSWVAFRPDQVRQVAYSLGGRTETGGDIGTGLGFRDFFGNFHEATGDEWFYPSGEYQPAIEMKSSADEFQKKRGEYMGHFDLHIATSIPGFSDLQAIVGDALVKTYGQSGAMVLDIGTSEGALIKTLAALSDSRITSVGIDPNLGMQKTFEEKDTPEGVEFRLEALGQQEQRGQLAWTEEDGTEINYYDPGDQKFDVIHEAMVFQFMSADRADHVNIVKSMMAPDGIAIFEEKFGTELETYNRYEDEKDFKWKSLYYTQEQIEQKRQEVLAKGGDTVEGMTKLQVTVQEMDKILSDNFKHYALFWQSGNFRGYAASDSLASLENFVNNMQDTSSDFSEVTTPEFFTEAKYSLSERRRANAEHELANLSVPLRQDGTLQLTHWSGNAGLTVLDPEQFGTGPIDGLERRRAGGGFINRIFYGLSGYRKEVPGSVRYNTTVDTELLYPVNADPERLRDGARMVVGQKGNGDPIYGGLDLNKYERAIREAGYEGIIGTGNFGPVVAMFEKLEPQSEVVDDTLTIAPTEVDGEGVPVAEGGSRVNNGGLVNGTARAQSDGRYSLGPAPVDTLGFYSRSADYIRGLNVNAQSASAWANQVRGAGNKGLVSNEELNDIGFFDWLESQTGKLTKEAVVSFIENDGVRMSQVVLGDEYEIAEDYTDIRNWDRTPGGGRTFMSYTHPEFEGYEILERADGDFDLVFTGSLLQRSTDGTVAPLIERAISHSGKQREAISGRPEHEGFQMDGPSSNYREFILTLPVAAPSREQVWGFLFDGEIYDYATRAEAAEAREDLIEDRGLIPSRVSEVRARATGPDPDLSPVYTHSHWPGIDNPLVHFRTNDREIDGGRTLFIEEVQSDWIQKGRQRGFRDPERERRLEAELAAAQKEFNPDADRMAYFNEKLAPQGLRLEFSDRQFRLKEDSLAPSGDMKFLHDIESAELQEEITRFIIDNMDEIKKTYETEDRLRSELRREQQGALPDPGAFKKSGSVELLAMKRALGIAVQEGYDAIAWTPAVVQIDRWSNELQQSVNGITWKPGAEQDRMRIEVIEAELAAERGMLQIAESGGDSVLIDTMQSRVARLEQRLEKAQQRADSERYLGVNTRRGQDIVIRYNGEGLITDGPNQFIGLTLGEVFSDSIAKQILAEPEGQITGEGLTIGGKGFKDTYDKLLPRSVGKYVKKMGGRVGVAKFRAGTGTALMPEQQAALEASETKEVWHLPITDQMREEIAKGQPRYSLQQGGEPGMVIPDVTIRNVQAPGDERYSFGPLAGVDAEPDRILREALNGVDKFIFAADRMRVGPYTGLDPNSGISIQLQGGPAYPFTTGNSGKAAWAVKGKNEATKILKRAREVGGHGLIALFARDNVLANPVFLDAYVAEVGYAIGQGQLSKAAFLREANRLRKDLKRSAAWKSGTAWARMSNSDWKDVEDFRMAMMAMPFEVRKNYFFSYNEKKVGANKGSKIGADALVNSGFPNLTHMLNLFVDESLDDLPTGTIIGAVKFDTDSEPVSAEELGVDPHGAYPLVLKGEGVAMFKDPIHVQEAVTALQGKTEHAAFRSSYSRLTRPDTFSLGPQLPSEQKAAPDPTQDAALDFAVRILNNPEQGLSRKAAADIAARMYPGAQVDTALFQAYSTARKLKPHWQDVRGRSAREATQLVAQTSNAVGFQDRVGAIYDDARRRFQEEYLRGGNDAEVRARIERQRKEDAGKAGLTKTELEDEGLWITDPVEQLIVKEEALRPPAKKTDDDEADEQQNQPVTDADIAEVTEVPQTISEYIDSVAEAVTAKTGLKPGDINYMEAYRATLATALEGSVRSLTYGKVRESLLNQVRKMQDLVQLDPMNRRAEAILFKTFQAGARTSRKELISQLKKTINKRLPAKKARKTTSSWTKDSVNKLFVRQMRQALKMIDMTPDDVEQRLAEIDEELDNGLPLYHKTHKERVIPADEYVANLQMEQEMLQRFGALNKGREDADGDYVPYKTMGEVQEAVDTAIAEIEDAIAKQKERLELRRAQMQNRRDMVIRAVKSGAGKAKRGPLADAINAVELYPMSLDALMQDLIRFAPPSTRGALWNDKVIAEGVLWNLKSFIRDTMTAQNNIRQRKHADMKALIDAIKSIYGIQSDTAAHGKLRQLGKLEREYSKYSHQDNPQPLSKAHLMQLLAYMDQEWYRENWEHDFGGGARINDYDAIRGELDAQDLALIDWMRDFYSKQRPELSAKKEAITGLPFPPDLDDNYMPVGIDRLGGFRGVNTSLQVTPAVYNERVRHRRDIDEANSILDLFFDRSHKNATFLELAELSIDVQEIFGDREVQEAIRNTYGKKYLEFLMRMLFDTMSQKPLRYDVDGVSRFLLNYGALVMTFNIGSAIRQPSSMWEFGMDHGVLQALSWSWNWIKPGMHPYIAEMFRSPQAVARFGQGQSYEIAAAFEAEGVGLMKSWMNKYGMAPNKFMDLLTVAVMGAGVYKKYHEHFMNVIPDEAEAKKLAMEWAWAEIETHQQSSFISNSAPWQRSGGVLQRAAGMFSSTPQQFLSIQNAAVRYGRATGDWKPMIRSIVVHHILGPAMYKAIETMFLAALGRPPEEDEWKEWLAFMLIGPYSGAFIGRFILSYAIDRAFDLGRNWGGLEMLPVEGGLERVIDSTIDMATGIATGDGDKVLEAIDSTAKTIAPYRYARDIIETAEN